MNRAPFCTAVIFLDVWRLLVFCCAIQSKGGRTNRVLWNASVLDLRVYLEVHGAAPEQRILCGRTGNKAHGSVRRDGGKAWRLYLFYAACSAPEDARDTTGAVWGAVGVVEGAGGVLGGVYGVTAGPYALKSIFRTGAGIGAGVGAGTIHSHLYSLFTFLHPELFERCVSDEVS
jgi:hypothetical protein